MRKVVLGLGISLDGYIARKNGSVDWLSIDWEYDWKAFFDTVETVLFGRRSWEKILEMCGDGNKYPYPGKQGYIFSKTLAESGADEAEVVSGDVEGFVNELRAGDGEKIWLSGGGELAAQFLKLDLVDEIFLGVTPVLLGSGIRLFQDFDREIQLRLIKNNSCFNSDRSNAMVELIYEVVRG